MLRTVILVDDSFRKNSGARLAIILSDFLLIWARTLGRPKKLCGRLADPRLHSLAEIGFLSLHIDTQHVFVFVLKFLFNDFPVCVFESVSEVILVGWASRQLEIRQQEATRHRLYNFLSSVLCNHAWLL